MIHAPISWRKGIFSTTYQIGNDNGQGFLSENFFSSRAESSLNGKKFLFVNQGLLSNSTHIHSSNDSLNIGNITFNSWGHHKAKVLIDGETYDWEFNSVWMNKWSIYKNGQLMIRYSGSSIKGACNVYSGNEALILTGLFIANHFWQRNITTMVAILVPLFIIL